jgi:type I restriction enzyme S subunit
MQQLFPREGETQPRLRFPEFQNAGAWVAGPLRQFAEVNPSRVLNADDVEVSFVPMASVSEDGYLASPQIRNYGLVKKGFTSFKDNDVIVAKITPCFENGKAALVTKLINGIGFGSTEFHVVRAKTDSLPAFVFAQIYSELFRQQGKASMTGSGGQQRIPTTFVENYLLCVPSLAEQHRIADCLTTLDTHITAATRELDALKIHKKGLMQQLFPPQEEVNT